LRFVVATEFRTRSELNRPYVWRPPVIKEIDMPAPRYAGGKTIALTTDLEGRWSRNWIQWNDLQNFWTRIFDWLRPGPSEQPIPLHEARVSLSASQPILDLFLYEEASADSQFRFSAVGKSGKSEGTLKKLAPGHYQAPCRSQLPVTTVSNLPRSGAAGE